MAKTEETDEDLKLEFDGTRCECGEDMFLVNRWFDKTKKKFYNYYGCPFCFRTRKVYDGETSELD